MLDPVAAALAGHSQRNARLLAVLRDRGVDITAPREIDLHFLAPNLDSAIQLEAVLKEAGFTQVSLGIPSAGDGSTSVTATVHEAPSSLTSTSRITEIISLAISVGAEHDGWGTSI